MQPHERHVTDRELLLDVDGEVSAARAAIIHAHLAECWSCRARKAGLERTLADFIQFHHRRFGQRLPPAEGPRSMLRARLGEVAAPAQPPWHHRYQAQLAAALVVVAIAVGGMWHRLPDSRSGTEFAPKAALTPGAARMVSREAVCSSSEASEARMVLASTAGEVFRQYGIHAPRPRAYEVDYLIPPDLGGTEDPRNLWPQPYSNGVWNSRVKDALEDRLRVLVCEGKLDLATAQRDIASDWIGAYKKYFQTDMPLPDHVAFVKDRPWE